MWKVKQIFDGEYGCEERMPGEKTKCLVTLIDENGHTKSLNVEDDWLTDHGIVGGKTQSATVAVSSVPAANAVAVD